jgi:K+-sensing histidine kinase KdpD
MGKVDNLADTDHSLLYVFTIGHVEEWIALLVFLVTAILTSQFAVAPRNRAEREEN